MNNEFLDPCWGAHVENLGAEFFRYKGTTKDTKITKRIKKTNYITQSRKVRRDTQRKSFCLSSLRPFAVQRVNAIKKTLFLLCELLRFSATSAL